MQKAVGETASRHHRPQTFHATIEYVIVRLQAYRLKTASIIYPSASDKTVRWRKGEDDAAIPDPENLRDRIGPPFSAAARS
jgi:hypothetical protein